LIQLFKSYKNIFWFIAFGYFFILMINITLKYIPFNTNTAFLQIKQTEVTQIPSYVFFFYLHVYTAIFALIAGFTQFSQIILKKYPTIHKYIGRVYVFTVLFLASPSGLFIGFYANGGIYSQISFVILAAFWFYFTLKGFIHIKNKKILLHKKFMLRSFALTFSAITLRLWKVILVYLFHPAPMDVYQIIAWLGWIPNLIFIEYYIYKKNKP
jgi:hypothetical protein